MPRPLTFTPEIGATILGARRVGAPLRQCAEAAGVPWRTFCDWLKAGRDGTDARFADFAAQVDTASAQVDTVLHARVMKGTEKDPRLALDVIKYRDAARARAAAEAELCVTRTTLVRTLNAASRGRLCVTRRGGEYDITEVLSREGGALHVEAVSTWPRPNLDIGNLLPRPKDTPR